MSGVVSEASVICRSKEVVSRVIEGELYIVVSDHFREMRFGGKNRQNDVLFKGDAIAARIWGMIQSRRSVGEIIGLLAKEFTGTQEEVVAKDVIALCSVWRDEGLIQIIR